ncbi:hypothetical protein L3X38_030125 [Prunus dulcis]|uniref:Uncharacterized protein n=1 Tax=Prunus dulcis TaxID=3755 RepID=A0AAD4YTP8_PRUDU|nr:hypothetical protein L3X38_030125 [Prunus dulcis]
MTRAGTGHDDDWRLSQVVYIVGVLLLGAISAVIVVVVKPWTDLLSPPIVVYSPRVLPVCVYDAHADCGKNVSAAFLVLYGIALATEGWGVVASLKFFPPFADVLSSAAVLVGDPTIMRDRAGNFVLPRADVMTLRSLKK